MGTGSSPRCHRVSPSLGTQPRGQPSQPPKIVLCGAMQRPRSCSCSHRSPREPCSWERAVCSVNPSAFPFFFLTGDMSGKGMPLLKPLGQLGEARGSGGAGWKRSRGSWQQRHGPVPVGRIRPYQTGFVPTAGTWQSFAHLVPWLPQKNGGMRPPFPGSAPGFGALWGVPWPGLCSASPLPPPDFSVPWAGQKCLLQALCVELRTGKLAPVGLGPALHHACHFSCTALMPSKRLCLPIYGKINPSRP